MWFCPDNISKCVIEVGDLLNLQPNILPFSMLARLLEVNSVQ